MSPNYEKQTKKKQEKMKQRFGETNGTPLPFIIVTQPNYAKPASPTSGMEDEVGLTKLEVLSNQLLAAVLIKKGKVTKTDIRRAVAAAQELLEETPR